MPMISVNMFVGEKLKDLSKRYPEITWSEPQAGYVMEASKPAEPV
jgi:hypothetical protein